MSIDLEFSRFANSYETYGIIQKNVTKHLLSLVDFQPKKILDLGCGSGNVYKMLSWDIEHFVGIDFAKNMLELHPKAKNVECIYGDFENPELYEYLLSYTFDIVLSSSALQWACDLDRVMRNVATLQTPVAFAIFGANTFKTLHQVANISSPLREVSEVETIVKRYFDLHHTEVQNYTLSFESNLEALRYIKRSGVSGKRGVLSYKETKKLIAEYPLSYLEFEVLYIKATPKNAIG